MADIQFIDNVYKWSLNRFFIYRELSANILRIWIWVHLDRDFWYKSQRSKIIWQKLKMQLRYYSIIFFLQTREYSCPGVQANKDRSTWDLNCFIQKPFSSVIHWLTQSSWRPREISRIIPSIWRIIYSSLEPLFIDYDYGMMLPRKRAFYPMAEFRKRGHDMHNLNNFFNE